MYAELVLLIIKCHYMQANIARKEKGLIDREAAF